jgi:hypothetical protein
MIWKRNEDRPKTGPSPLEKFKADLARVISEAEDAGVLAIHIGRQLQSHAQWFEHRAALRNAGMGGR